MRIFTPPELLLLVLVKQARNRLFPFIPYLNIKNCSAWKFDTKYLMCYYSVVLRDTGTTRNVKLRDLCKQVETLFPVQRVK